MTIRLLALDTATEACSVALWSDDCVQAQRKVLEPRGHTRQLLPMVEEVLAETGYTLADLDGLVCTRGPGSFTGVRVGVSAVQGLAFAADLPVLPVSTLDVLAWQAHRSEPGYTRWQVAMDARMNEIYYAGYRVDAAGLIRETAEQLLAPEALAVSTDSATGRTGAGWALPPLDQHPLSVNRVLPEASGVAAWGVQCLRTQVADNLWVMPEALQPVYLRDRVAHKSAGV